MNKKAKRILIVYYNPDSLKNTRVTIIHHLKVLESIEKNNYIEYHNVNNTYQEFILKGERPGCPSPNIRKEWDAIILHYSFLSIRTIGYPFRYLKKDFSWINDLNGLKIAIPQDEGDYAGILDEWLFELGTDVIFSVHYKPDRPLYPIMRKYATIYPCLPGYIDENTALGFEKKVLPISMRGLDIVYRARKLPQWFGKAGQIKHRIAEMAKSQALKKGYKVDISTKEEDTIPGPQWLNFIANGKVVLGTQGGYSTIDWRGEVKAQVKKIIETHPGINYQKLYEEMPLGWDSHRLFTITPRHFEAVITNTCQMLICGEYKGILVPDRHYIEINSDWSNLEQVIDRICNNEELQKIADQAREDILYSGKYSYKVFAKKIERVMNDHHYSKTKSVKPIEETAKSDKVLDTIERQFIAQRDELLVFEDHIKQILTEKYFEEGFKRVIYKGLEKYRSIMLKWILGLFITITVIISIVAIILIHIAK